MIRWYDYMFAILASHFIIFFFSKGATSSNFWEPIFYGLAAGFIWRFWETDYCAFRLKQEEKK